MWLWLRLPELSPESSAPWRMLEVRGSVPLAWGLKMDDESSSRVQPRRYAAFWAHSCLANCLRPAEERREGVINGEIKRAAQDWLYAYRILRLHLFI